MPTRLPPRRQGDIGYRAGRWDVTICTRGGNQSWSGCTKHFAADRCDHLLVVTADGRRWFIPADRVSGGTHLLLGGPKYVRYEVETGDPFPGWEPYRR